MDSAFIIPTTLNFGKTKIDSKEHPFVGINTNNTSEATYTLSGWEGGTPTGNNT